MKLEDILPTKSLTQLVEAAITSLKAQSFRVTNFRPGSVFLILLQIALQGTADLQKYLLNVLKQAYLVNAQEGWLDIKAYDLTRTIRKPAIATEGNFAFNRLAGGAALPIPSGTILKVTIGTKELRFNVKTTTVLPIATLTVDVPVIAEQLGAAMNLGAGQTIKLVTYLSGIDSITNDSDWITVAGADKEADESLRSRALNRWDELASGGSALAYQSRAESILGVASAWVDDQHPRGQGTVDIYITASNGIPTTDLVADVQTEIDLYKSLVADVLVTAPDPVTVAASVTLTVDPNYADNVAIAAEAQAIWTEMFSMSRTVNPNYPNVIRVNPVFDVDRSLIITNLRKITNVVSVIVTSPGVDVSIDRNELAVAGVLTLTFINAVIS